MRRVIVFDFDGVLVDSNQVKIDAFVTVLPETEPQLRKLMKEMYDPGETRYEMFEAVLKKSGKSENEIPDLIKKYSEQYNKIVQEHITRRGLAQEVLETLRGLQKSECILYLFSNTPLEALRETVNRLGILGLFKSVLGRPRSKKENLRAVIEKERVAPVLVVVVGDGESDRQAASELGCFFIGLRNSHNGWTEVEKFPTINSIHELIKKI